MRCENCYGTLAEMLGAKDAKITEANKRIAELESEVAELKQERNDLNYLCMERLHKIEELQANNRDLRKALETIAAFNIDVRIKPIAEQALSATPAESLQAHDDVPVCEECNVNMHPFAHDGISGYSCDGCGWYVDDLKGKV